MDETTYRYYSNRLSAQMSRIAEVGREIASTFGAAAAVCPDSNFISDALRTFQSIGGTPGDAALEIYRDLDDDIRTAERFLDRWEGRSGPGYDPVLHHARILHRELIHLRDIVGEAGPEVMAEAQLRIRAQRSGCFVATVVYGHTSATEVATLRQFRDEVLQRSRFGRLFVQAYYYGFGALAASSVQTFLRPARPVIRRFLDHVVDQYRNSRLRGGS